MHEWGDEWFENNGEQLYAAINFIESFLRKHHIGICGKEKWGCYIDEYLTFWNGGIYQILFGYRVHIGSFHKYKNPKLDQIINKIHHWIYFILDNGIKSKKKDETVEEYVKRVEKRWWKGLCHITEKIGLKKLVNDYQAKMYNKAFQLARKKYPMVQEELISDLYGYKMIKPCKWGNVDGEKIHNKHWTTFEPPQFAEK
jgi:hypothetical protein